MYCAFQGNTQRLSAWESRNSNTFRERVSIVENSKESILAWDPDFTKVTAEEKKKIDKADEELARGEYVSHEDVWADVG